MSIFVQHILLYFFIIVSSTLLGLFEAPHILQVDMGDLSPNPIGLFCTFSCQHILFYFQGCFGALNVVFLARHSETVSLVSNRDQRLDQKVLRNLLSQSKMMVYGIPKWTHTHSKKRLAVYAAMKFFSQAVRMAIFENQSTTTNT
jgi:hypothetical protein